MDSSRLEYDPTLSPFTEHLRLLSLIALRHLVVDIIKRSIDIKLLDEPLAYNSLSFIEQGQRIPTDLVHELRVRAQELDNQYLSLAEKGAEKSRDAFSKARLLWSIVFASEFSSRHSLEEALYEAFIGSCRDQRLLAIIREHLAKMHNSD